MKNDEDRRVCLSFCSTSTIPLGSSLSSGDGDGMIPIAGKQRFAPKLVPVAWKRCSRDISVWKRCVWGLRSGTRDSWEWGVPSCFPVCRVLQQLLQSVHSFLELCPGLGRLILNDPAWDLACGELPVSCPRCPAWEREDAPP